VNSLPELSVASGTFGDMHPGGEPAGRRELSNGDPLAEEARYARQRASHAGASVPVSTHRGRLATGGGADDHRRPSTHLRQVSLSERGARGPAASIKLAASDAGVGRATHRCAASGRRLGIADNARSAEDGAGGAAPQAGRR
jgi:hypothetical protein